MSSKVLKHFYQEYPLQTIRIGGKVWEYIKKGTGKKTLVILPGGFENAQITFEQIEVFQKEYTVISITINNCDSINELCIAINAILDKEKIQKIYLYGLSLTGLLVQSYTKRNKERVEKLIISHAAAPQSKTYLQKSIFPLRILQPLAYYLPMSWIKFLIQKIGYSVQANTNKQFKFPEMRKKNQQVFQLILHEFFEKYYDRKFIKTIYRLHYNFVCETFDHTTFADWKGKVLILQTDNDPLMGDNGAFKTIYPDAKVVTFHGTGHLTLYFQFPDVVQVIHEFLKS